MSRSFLQEAFGQHDLDHFLNRLLASPVALQLGGERDPTERPASGLNDTLQAGAMRFDGS